MNQRKLVVIAEDRPATREYLGNIISRLGVDVYTAEDGNVAWNYIQKHQPHLLVTDIGMPNMDGYSLIKTIQGLETKVPVIVVSGEFNPEIVKDYPIPIARFEKPLFGESETKLIEQVKKYVCGERK